MTGRLLVEKNARTRLLTPARLLLLLPLPSAAFAARPVLAALAATDSLAALVGTLTLAAAETLSTLILALALTTLGALTIAAPLAIAALDTLAALGIALAALTLACLLARPRSLTLLSLALRSLTLLSLALRALTLVASLTAASTGTATTAATSSVAGLDSRTVLEPELALGDDRLARLDTFTNHDVFAGALRDDDGPLLDSGIALHHEDVLTVLASLDGLARHDRRV